MLNRGSHTSIQADELAAAILNLEAEEFASWPEAVRELGRAMAEELFLVRCNPFVDPDLVYESVQSEFSRCKAGLDERYAGRLEEGINRFWDEYDEDQTFREEVLRRLAEVLPPEAIAAGPEAVMAVATDATDLRLELPMFMLMPDGAEQIQEITRLAAEMGFSLVPRGGGSGMTGGAIPYGRRCAILSLTRMKRIFSVDPESMSMRLQTGVITQIAINAAADKNLLFTVDPASKTASSIGGNIAENAGGPFAFEYGTTLDNLLSYQMVMPDASLISVQRRHHPRHKIMPDETAIFDLVDQDGNIKDTIELPGSTIRGAGLGKDVTNKWLGGLPGVQKEGVDGIITEAVFVLHPKPLKSRTLCLEFFGRSMHTAMLVIKDIIALRDSLRVQGHQVRVSALEEFNSKYVEAIEYRKKSTRYDGEPISVLLVQLDADDQYELDLAAEGIMDICAAHDNVDAFAAATDEEAEVFWEDRHKLSAIAKRTSGFKLNEDIVIPTDSIPTFADFLEQLNLTYLARTYRKILQEIGRLPGIGVNDKFINMEFNFTSKVLMGEVTAKEVSEQEMETQVFFFLRDLKNRYPELAEEIEKIYSKGLATRLVIASHMHAGDGNCHVNLPVNSNDPEMMKEAEEAVTKVFDQVLKLDGEVSGEHGIGITKIAYLSREKIEALRLYKEKIDPRGIFNPGKLTARDKIAAYTFSFNRLISDIESSGLADKEKLILLLRDVQVCTRCGKCKHVCPMYYPQQGMLYHPRNKNLSIGALAEAIYYSQSRKGKPDKRLLATLAFLVEHCTGCGKCAQVCPVKIKSADVAMNMRAYIEDKKNGGAHPFKTRILNYLSADVPVRAPLAAKAAGVGQSVQNKMLGLVPDNWRRRFENPLFSGPGPASLVTNLAEALRLKNGNIFVPRNLEQPEKGDLEAVFYFPGCGAGLFYRSVGLAGLLLLLSSGVAVILPDRHMCCGYPLLAAGCSGAFAANQQRNITELGGFIHKAEQHDLNITAILTACGSCREGLALHDLAVSLPRPEIRQLDMVQFMLEKLPPLPPRPGRPLLYHQACHAEWSGVPLTTAGAVYRKALQDLTGSEVAISPGCCAESGMGAMTSPAIYNVLRDRKRRQLEADLAAYPEDRPIVVGCPSCRIGISRTLMQMKKDFRVLHVMEFLAEELFGPDWQSDFVRAALASVDKNSPIRAVDMSVLAKKSAAKTEAPA